jgi:hypothetical protein
MQRKPLIIAACFGLFVLSAILIWSAVRNAKPPFLNASAPAYETLRLAAQRQVNRESPGADELAAYIATNSFALAKVREALEQKFEAPEGAYGSSAAMAGVLNEVGGFKSLAVMLKNEGRLYEHENKRVEAAHSYADVIRLGTKIESGTIIFALVGIGIERIGLEALQELEPSLEGTVRREIAAKLHKINSERVQFAAIEERERYIRRRHSPTPLHYVFFARQVRAATAGAQNKYETARQAVDALAKKLGTR